MVLIVDTCMCTLHLQIPSDCSTCKSSCDLLNLTSVEVIRLTTSTWYPVSTPLGERGGSHETRSRLADNAIIVKFFTTDGTTVEQVVSYYIILLYIHKCSFT